MRARERATRTSRRPVTSLARGRLYHYRLVATSDAGTSRGADQTFSTSGVPTVVTNAASSIGLTSARLNGRVTPNGQATTWYFDYGTTTSYGSRTAAQERRLGHERRQRLVVADRACGRPPPITTAWSRRTPPGPPWAATGPSARRSRRSSRQARARDVGSTTATLTGSANPRGRATTWWFEYGTTTRYGSQTSRRSAGSGSAARSLTAALTGLRPGTTYHYRLVATSDAGSSRGADVAFTTVGVTLTAPALHVVYGRGILLAGTVPVKRAGEVVTVFAQAFGGGSFASIATVLTAADGTWRYLAKPRIRTSYQASWSGGMSAADDRGRPAVDLAAPDLGRPAVDARRRRCAPSPAASSSSSGETRPGAGSRSSVCA